MIYAVISDVHANPWALQRALDDARAQGAEKFVCLGDVVGYGPDAVGAAKLARKAFDVVVLGNHDAATAGLISSVDFRLEAQIGVQRHARELPEENLAWLRELPLVHRARTFLAAHGSVSMPEQFPYVADVGTALAAFRAMKQIPLSFVGHTHASLWIGLLPGGKLLAERSDTLKIDTRNRYIVNVGSVGYPRNEAESVYVLYDSRRHLVTWRRLPFDYDAYFKAMEKKKIYIAPWLRENAQAAKAKKTT